MAAMVVRGGLLGDRVLGAARLLMLLAFFASVATMLSLRSPAWDTSVEGGRYFIRYKQLRHEVTRKQYDQNEAMMWRNRASSRATVVMFLSLFGFIGIESLRHRRPGARRAR